MMLRLLLLLGLSGFVFLGANSARAQCPGVHQVSVENYGSPVMRSILVGVQRDLEDFFKIRFSAFCLDKEEQGAYYDIKPKRLVFGVDFLNKVANAPGNLNRAIAIMSHEAAHAFQAKHGLLDKLIEKNKDRVKCIELHADFLAGGFMRKSSEDNNVSLGDITKMFYSLGDDYVDYNEHHGLSAERYLSFRQGFYTATKDVVTLSSMGIAYVSQTDCDN